MHEHGVQLRWSDPDSLGHGQASVLEEAQRPRVVDVAERGFDARPDVILARLEVDYLRQLHYRAGERLTVRSWIPRLGTKSFTVRQELVQDGDVAIRADVVMVGFDYAANSTRALTDEERAHWSRYAEPAG